MASPLAILKKKIPENLFLITGLLGFIAILIITFCHQQPPLFDEAYFVKNFDLYKKYGLSREFLLQMQDQAPGPLYELVHFAFKPFTNLTTPGIRLVNVLLLGLTILLLSKIISLTKNLSFGQSLNFAIAIIAIPMVWQVTGLALTEMPAMFFSMLSVLLLLLAVRNEKTAFPSSILALLAGLAYGLSVMGRSPFLVLGFASLALLLPPDLKSRARWRTVLIYCACGLGISMPMFMTWKALVPPQQNFVGEGFSIWHGILAFAYGAFIAIIIAPKWFYFNRKIVYGLMVCYLLFLGFNILIFRFEYAPLSVTLASVFPPSLMHLYSFVISPFLATLSVYFIFCCLRQGWRHKSDPFFLFLLLSGMLLLASSLKVTHLFSSRYVAQAVPFFILLFPRYDSPTVARLLRLLLGMFIGVASLETYFQYF